MIRTMQWLTLCLAVFPLFASSQSSLLRSSRRRELQDAAEDNATPPEATTTTTAVPIECPTDSLYHCDDPSRYSLPANATMDDVDFLPCNHVTCLWETDWLDPSTPPLQGLCAGIAIDPALVQAQQVPNALEPCILWELLYGNLQPTAAPTVPPVPPIVNIAMDPVPLYIVRLAQDENDHKSEPARDMTMDMESHSHDNAITNQTSISNVDLDRMAQVLHDYMLTELATYFQQHTLIQNSILSYRLLSVDLEHLETTYAQENGAAQTAVERSRWHVHAEWQWQMATGPPPPPDRLAFWIVAATNAGNAAAQNGMDENTNTTIVMAPQQPRLLQRLQQQIPGVVWWNAWLGGDAPADWEHNIDNDSMMPRSANVFAFFTEPFEWSLEWIIVVVGGSTLLAVCCLLSYCCCCNRRRRRRRERKERGNANGDSSKPKQTASPSKRKPGAASKDGGGDTNDDEAPGSTAAVLDTTQRSNMEDDLEDGSVEVAVVHPNPPPPVTTEWPAPGGKKKQSRRSKSNSGDDEADPKLGVIVGEDYEIFDDMDDDLSQVSDRLPQLYKGWATTTAAAPAPALLSGNPVDPDPLRNPYLTAAAHSPTSKARGIAAADNEENSKASSDDISNRTPYATPTKSAAVSTLEAAARKMKASSPPKPSKPNQPSPTSVLQLSNTLSQSSSTDDSSLFVGPDYLGRTASSSSSSSSSSAATSHGKQPDSPMVTKRSEEGIPPPQPSNLLSRLNHQAASEDDSDIESVSSHFLGGEQHPQAPSSMLDTAAATSNRRGSQITNL